MDENGLLLLLRFGALFFPTLVVVAAVYSVTPVMVRPTAPDTANAAACTTTTGELLLRVVAAAVVVVPTDSNQE